MIKKIPLNDNWLFRPSFTPACLENDFSWTDSFVAQLPHNAHCEDTAYFDERKMQTCVTYSRILTVPEAYNGKRLLLRFEGVLSYAEVYVNGTFVASHKGETPFVADVTAPLRYDRENRIVLKVDSRIRDKAVGVRGPLIPFCGIHRDVFFLICDGRDIRDICIRYSGEGATRTVAADVELFDFYPDTELDGEISDSGGKRVGVFALRSVGEASVRLKGEAENVQCWSPETPALYTATVRLKSGKKVLDTFTQTFAFRTVSWRKDGFYLNGKRTPLTGLLRADSYPVIGRAATAETEKRDARAIKALGVNAVRTMGLSSKDFLEECDRIGLMVLEDVYGDGYVGGTEWRAAFLESVTDMILRDRNHPCVIGWGVRVNNSPDCDELYFKAVQAAKAADPTRATVGARSFTYGRLLEDVFAYNETPGNYRGKRKNKKRFVPFLIGEHGGKNCAAKTFDGANVRLAQALSHLKAVSDIAGGAAIGGFGMCFADFATGRYRGSGDNVCRYGVTDAYRNPKWAAAAYRSQTEDAPVLVPAGNLSEDEFDGALTVFTNADSVALYRGDDKVGEFYPDRKSFPNVKHPPVRIRDFCGNLPARELGDGFCLKLFKSVLREAEKKGSLNLGFAGTKKTLLLRLLRKLDASELAALLEKYARIPPHGVVYRLEGVYGGETKIEHKFTHALHPALQIRHSCPSGVLQCVKSYERICFTLCAHDGAGNDLDYCFAPVTVAASGSLRVEGNGHLGLEGGKGGFFVRSVAPGPGRVTVTSEWGTQVFDFACEYGQVEKL